MALDEALLDAHVNGDIGDCFRLFHFSPSAATLGYFQCAGRELDIGRCKELEIDVVRRPTGGGCVFHDESGELTYSVVASSKGTMKEIIASYSAICSCVVRALGRLGIESSFSPVNDIVAGKKKISGSAQTRRGDSLLQHGTIMISTDLDTLEGILKVDGKKLAGKGVASVRKRVTTLQECNPDITESSLAGPLVEEFEKIVRSPPLNDISPSIIEHAHQLEKEKYSKAAFTFRR